MNVVLAIDATLQGVALGLFSCLPSGRLEFKASAVHVENARSTAALAELTRSLLLCTGAKVSDLKTILVASGPGSFTGIKVGVAFAQGLARGQNQKIDLVGFSTIEMMASYKRDNAIWMLPSTQTEGYGAFFHDGKLNVVIVKIEDSRVLLLDEVSRNPIEWPTSMNKVALLQPWPSLVNRVNDLIELSPLPMPMVAGILFGSISDFWSDDAFGHLFQRGPLQPRYIRMSAPEERRYTGGIHGT